MDFVGTRTVARIELTLKPIATELPVGERDGTFVGENEGTLEGDAVGIVEGVSEGDSVGVVVGALDGACVVGDDVGDTLPTVVEITR
mmetsp:Transcript_29091/g.57110  ORF Transcript_29091/g.57110 Transcript_29091/m.57110 type:complete len:87 (+) Transcript_29091:2056-2316(+)